MEKGQQQDHLAIVASQNKQEKAYWVEQLAGALGKTSFPLDVQQGTQVGRGKINFDFSSDLCSRMVQLSKGSDTRLHVILMAGLMALLERYTSQEDLMVGTPIYKQEVTGDFINTLLPIRQRVLPTMSFKEVLMGVSETIFQALEHQNYPWQTLLDEQGIGTTDEGSVIFDQLLLLENIQDRAYSENLQVEMQWIFRREGEQIQGEVEYRTDVYHEETVEGILQHWLRLLEVALNDPGVQLEKISVLSPAEEEELIYGRNQTEVELAEQLIQQLFEVQVAQTPDQVAVICGQEQLTYAQLNQRANQLARSLRKAGVQPDSPVAILMERSLEMVIGILGVLKAGGAYLPIEPENPEERIEFLLEDSQTQIVLTDGRRELKYFSGLIFDLTKRSHYQGKSDNLDVVTDPQNLAYIIYTSGTTGQPKGVMVEQAGVVNYITWAAKQYAQSEQIDFPLYTSISFDLTVTSIFTPLITGNRIIVYPGHSKEFLIREVLNDPRVGVVKLTPAHLKLMLDQKMDASNLKALILGGEDLKESLAREMDQKLLGQVKIYNEYGPTETVVGCMVHQYDPEKDHRGSVAIGLPIANTQIYILDRQMRPTPVGVAGEMYISGQGVARGYLQRPELTTEKFVLNPFIPGQRMYRTGDLARWLSDGKVEFLGRIDHQVKIRGYRIEPDEIGAHLQALPEIREGIVIAREDEQGEKFLCAYYVPETEVEPDRLRESLSSQLPDYMIPTFFGQIDEIPLTSNGKVDLKALPEPMVQTAAIYQPPGNEIEERLVEIWQEVLGVEQIGINDNFFGVGGDSIKAIQVSARLQKYGYKLDIMEIFSCPTIAELALCATRAEREIDQGLVEGQVELTPIQKWFFETYQNEPSHYNHAVLLRREQGFDPELVEDLFYELMEHHDALRISYFFEEGQVVQFNEDLNGELFELTTYDLTEESDWNTSMQKIANEIQQGMDLEEGPLVKLGLFQTDQADYLLIVIHHLLIDGVSWRILLEDFRIGYQQLENDEMIELQEKTDSFQYWSDRLQEYAQSEQLLAELDYWAKIEETPVPPVPKDHLIDDSLRKHRYSAAVEVELSESQTTSLLKEVNQAYHTEINDILLTALSLALQEWTGQKSCLVNLEGHGREEFIGDLNIKRTIGWFTCQFPVVLQSSESADLGTQIKEVKETLRQIPNKGIGYGILRYLSSHPGVSQLTTNPEISFNYLGQFGQETGSGDLFQLSDLPTGETMSAESERLVALDVSGMVVNGKLTLSFVYNQKEFDQSRMEELATSYQSHLTQIIAHCTGKEEAELTPADFDYSDLTLDELDGLEGLVLDIE